MLGNFELSLLQRIYADNVVFLLSSDGILTWFNDNARPILGAFPDKTIDLKVLVTKLSDYAKEPHVTFALKVEHINQHYALIFSLSAPPTSIDTQVVNKIKATLLDNVDLQHVLRLISNHLKTTQSLELCLSLKQLDLSDELIIYTTSHNQALVGQTTSQPAFSKAYPNRRIITQFNLPIGSIYYSADLDDERTRIADFLIKQNINQVIANQVPLQDEQEKTDNLILQHQDVMSFIVDEFGKIIGFRSGNVLAGIDLNLINRSFLSLFTRQTIKNNTIKNITKFGIKRQSDFQNFIMEADVIGEDSFSLTSNGIGLPSFKATAHIIKVDRDKYLIQLKELNEFGEQQVDVSSQSEAISFLRMLNTPIALLKQHHKRVQFLLTSTSFNELFELEQDTEIHVFSVIRTITRSEFKSFKAKWYAAVAADISFIWTGSVIIKGMQKWLEVGCASPKNFYAGKPTYFFINDVSKHVHQAETINQLNSKIKLANRGAGIGIWSYNYQDGITYWDDTMYSLLDISKSKHEASDKIKVLKSILHKDDIEGTFKTLKSTLEAKSHLIYQNRIIYDGDKVKWIKTVGFYYANLKTNEESFFGASWDITDIKEAQLRAERTSLEKGRFLANMSHELKTPLHGLITALEHCKDTELSAEQVEFTEIAHECAHSTLELIEDILLYSKITSDNLILDKQRVNITHLLAKKLRNLLPLAKNENNQLTFEYGCKMPSHLEIDQEKITLLIRILVSNALKFTQNGQVKALFSYDYQTHLLGVTVTDNGIGIDEKELNYLFEPFVQGDLSSTKQFSGAGLGLAIAKALVAVMQGTIEVKSKPNKGSTFYISIPCKAFDTPIASINELFSVIVISDDTLDIELDCCDITRLNHHSEVSAQQLDQADLVIFDTEYSESHDAKILKWARQTSHPVAYIADLPIKGSEKLKNLFRLSSIAKCRAYEIKDILVAKLRKPASKNNTAPVADKNTASPPSSVKGSVKQNSKPQPKVAAQAEAKELDTTTIILVVEDNPVNQLLAKAILQKQYTNVLVAENGQVALDSLAKQDVDLILMDCQMPVMDGIAATIAIRTKMHNTDVPILALTANAFDDDKQKCLNAGMDDFIAKPVDGVSLLEKIEFWLNNKKPKLKTKTMQ